MHLSLGTRLGPDELVSPLGAGFYRANDDLMSVEIRSKKPLVLGDRKKLLDVSGFEPGYFHDFDVSPDGKRFLFIRAGPGARPTRIDVMLNWFPELQRRAGR